MNSDRLLLPEAEIITLQEASYLNGAQHYPSCVQVRVTSNGSKVLPGGVSFPGKEPLDSESCHRPNPFDPNPGTYLPGQPGLMWPPEGSETADPAKYPLPGGDVWEGSPGGGIYGLDA